jgi:1,3-beta-glucan synthase
MSGYPNHPPPPKHAPSSYSSGSSDPFNPSVQQLPYGEQPLNPYGGPNPGAGGAGVAPPLAGGQYAPMYDTEAEMARRYAGGGSGPETYLSDAGNSQSGG